MSKKTTAKISCRVTAAMLRFADERGFPPDELVANLGPSRRRLEDTRGWVDAAVVQRLWRRLERASDNHEIGAEVGLFAVRNNVFGAVETMLRLFGTIGRTLQRAETLAAYFSTALELTPMRVGSSSASLEMRGVGDRGSTYHDVNFVRGVIAGVPELWGQPLARVEVTRFGPSIQECSPIDNRVYAVHENGRVTSHPVGARVDSREEGALDPDGGFTVGEVTYGASATAFHITWEQAGSRWSLQRIFPTHDALADTVAGLENDLRAMERMYAELEEARATLQEKVDERTGELQKKTDELSATAAQLERQSRLKSEFIADFSHELRTLITSIIGFADLLGSGVYGDLNERQVEACDRISANTRALLHATNDLLDLNKLQAGKLSVVYHEVHVKELLAEIAQFFSPLVAEKDIQLRTELFDDAPAVLVTDRAKLKNILVNLINNAIKFTDAGHVAVTVRGEGPGSLSFSVEDTGCGIDEFDLPSLFEEFGQIGRATQDRPLLGFGLRIAKKLVDLLHGSISMGSHVGQGTDVTVTLPIRPADADLLQEELPLASLTAARADRTVVIADPSREESTFLRLSLEAVGLHAEICHDGREVLGLVRANDADLLIIDPLLNFRDGWQVLQDLRADPSLANVPVILVSENLQDDLAAAYRVAASFAKPVDREALVKRVLGLLRLDEA